MPPHRRAAWTTRVLTAVSARDRWLAPDLAAGLGVGVVALLLFGAIAEQVMEHGSLTRLDLTLVPYIAQYSSVRGLELFQAVSLLGAPVTVAGLGAAVGVTLLVRRRWILVVGWIVALGGAGLLNRGLKVAVHRARPAHAAAYLHHLSFSFPSGHTMGSMVGYGMLAYLLLLHTRRRDMSVVVVTLATVLILAIGFSRLYLGVHYFSDVAGGYTVGGFWLSVSVTGTEIARRRYARSLDQRSSARS